MPWKKLYLKPASALVLISKSYRDEPRVRYRPEIDGLRAIAILPVILFHAGFGFFGGGFVGVDVFFVISGYLITSLLIAELDRGQFSLYRFYERRARRILPALYVVMATCIPFAWLYMLPEQFADFAASSFATVLSISNFYFLSQVDYFAPNAELQPLLHTWSLAVEEQYYLFFPLSLMALWRFGRGKVFVICVIFVLLSLLVAEIGWRENMGRNFFFTLSRLWEIGMGSICAFILARHPLQANNMLSLAGLVAILFAVFYFDGTTPFPSIFALLPVGGTALIILFAGQATWVARLLSTAPLVAIGLISYSAYLWHQPLFAFARLSSLKEPAALVMLSCALVSLGLAYVTWRFVEQPLRRRVNPVLATRKSLWGSAALISATFLAFGVAGHMTDGTWARSGSMPDFILQAKGDKNDYTDCLRTFETFDAEIAVQSCSAGAPTAPLVVLLGDSHADHYAHALREAAQKAGYRFWQLTANSCLPITGLVAQTRDCTKYTNQVMALLQNAHPELILLSARWTVYLTDRRFDNGEGGVENGLVDTFILPNHEIGSPAYPKALFDRFESGIEALLGLGRKILVIYPSPEAGWDVPELFAKLYAITIGSDDNIQISTSWQRYKDRNKISIEFLDSLADPRISRFRSSDVLCDTVIPDRCVNAFGEKILYYDDDHFSNTGAMFLQKALISAVTDALRQD